MTWALDPVRRHDEDEQHRGHTDDDEGTGVGLQPTPADRRRTPPAPTGSPAPPDQDRLAWLMQNRVAGMASSRAGLIGTSQASQRP